MASGTSGPDVLSTADRQLNQGHDNRASVEREQQQQQRSVKESQQAKRDHTLDEALEDTFPASDPVNLTPDAPKKIVKGPH